MPFCTTLFLQVALNILPQMLLVLRCDGLLLFVVSNAFAWVFHSIARRCGFAFSMLVLPRRLSSLLLVERCACGFNNLCQRTLFCNLSLWSAKTPFVLSHACFAEVVGFFSCHVAFEGWTFTLFNPCCQQMAFRCPTLIDFCFVPRAFAFRRQFLSLARQLFGNEIGASCFCKVGFLLEV